MDLKYEHLLGKEWVMNEQDCFSIVQGFFGTNFPDIPMPDISRPQDWDADKIDLIRMAYPRMGFYVTDEDWNELRPGDVLAQAIGTANPNHLAVYIGGNEIIHHRFGITSCKEILRPYWRMTTMFTLRHPDVPDLRPKMQSTPLEEIIRGRLRLQVP